MAARLGQTGACEQERNGRVRHVSAGAGSYPTCAGRRAAPLCNGLHHQEDRLGKL